MKKHILVLSLIFLSASLYAQSDELTDPRSREKHFENIRSITQSGNNIKPAPSMDANLMIQSDERSLDIDANGCPQLYFVDAYEFNAPPRLIRTGQIANMDGVFVNPDLIAHSYDKDRDRDCMSKQPTDLRTKALNPTMEIQLLNFRDESYMSITENDRYDGDLDINVPTSRVVYVSTETGDPELWITDLDSKEKHPILEALGYEANPSFSQDGEFLVFVGTRPESMKEKKEYNALLQKNQVKLENMDIYVCRADGSDLRRVTKLGATMNSPRFTPDGQHIIFSSNHLDTKKDEFQIFMVDLDGQNLQQITFLGDFNAYPVFSPMGDQIFFTTNRQSSGSSSELNVVGAVWVE